MRNTEHLREMRDSFLAKMPSIYPIVDTAYLESTGQSAIRFAELLADSDICVAQYRHKGEFTRHRFEEVAAIAKLFQESNTCLIMNDRTDIALAVGAHGVHVGQEDLLPEEVRRLVGPDMLIGYSTHNAEQLAAPECLSADYLAIGPVYETASKGNPDPVVGLQGIRNARHWTNKPLVGIGGISLENAVAVFAAGANCVSMISGISEQSLDSWLALDSTSLQMSCLDQ